MGYNAPNLMEQTAPTLSAEKVEQLLKDLAVKSGAPTDQAWKDLRDRLEVRKLLREAKEKGYDLSNLNFDAPDLMLTKEVKGDFISNLKDRVLGDIDHAINFGRQSLDQLFQLRMQAMQFMQYILKVDGEMKRTPARNISGR